MANMKIFCLDDHDQVSKALAKAEAISLNKHDHELHMVEYKIKIAEITGDAELLVEAIEAAAELATRPTKEDDHEY